VAQIRLAQWLKQFRALHDRARSGALPAEERGAYDAAREELARALLAAQRVQARPGQSRRSAMRVSIALQADLELAAGAVRALTLDLGAGGFGTLLARQPAIGETVKFTLRLPGGDRVGGGARVAGVVASAGSARVAFAFQAVPAEDLEKIELLVFDTVLEQLRTEAA
jgi:hypothetical protein